MKRLFVLIYMMLFAVTFPLLVCEISLRLVYREEEVNGNYWGIGAFAPSDSLGYMHRPGFKGFAARKDVFLTRVEINQLGLRQRNSVCQIQYRRRILILGDSFAFGLGVEEQSTFVTLIQENLNTEGIGVINGAQTGYCPEQEKILGMRLARLIHPDSIILFLYPGNDIHDNYQERFRNIDVVDGYRLAKDRWLPVSVLDFCRTRSYLWMYTVGKFNRLKNQEHVADFSTLARLRTAEVIEPTLGSLRDLRDYCDRSGIHLGVILIPGSRGRSIFQDSLIGFLMEEDFSYLDLGDMGFNQTHYFGRDGHWNDMGHKKAAIHVLGFLEFFNLAPDAPVN